MFAAMRLASSPSDHGERPDQRRGVRHQREGHPCPAIERAEVGAPGVETMTHDELERALMEGLARLGLTDLAALGSLFNAPATLGARLRGVLARQKSLKRVGDNSLYRTCAGWSDGRASPAMLAYRGRHWRAHSRRRA
jgi:hypothetical protein